MFVTFSHSSSAFAKNHKPIGYTLVYLGIIVVGIGFLSKGSMLICRFITWYVKFARFVHALIGYLTILFSQIAILTGMYTFDASSKALYFIQMVAILISFVAVETLFYFGNKKYYNPILTKNPKRLKSMTLKAFYESDKKLALFNDYVVDLTTYAFEHPGCTYMIQQCNKKEIGKYIYGAFSMENRVSPHRHSFIAMNILQKLIIARIIPDRQLDSQLESRRSFEKYGDNETFIEVSIGSIRKTSFYNLSLKTELSK